MQAGELVKVKTAGGAVVERRVVAVEGDMVYVCRPETFHEAEQLGTTPRSVGFNKQWVVEVESRDR